MEIEITKKIVKIEAFAKSETEEGHYYKVTCEDDLWSCSCPHFQNRRVKCKHIEEVESRI